MSTKNETARQIAATSSDDLVDLLRLAVEGENEKIDDVHSLAIAGVDRFHDSHESGTFFSMMNRVLESAADRQYIDALIGELGSRLKAWPDVTPGGRPEPSTQPQPARSCAPAGNASSAGLVASKRAYLTRQALSNLMMATMEMHTYSGTTDAAFELTEKALDAIGTLRIMTNGGRVQP